MDCAIDIEDAVETCWQNFLLPALYAMSRLILRMRPSFRRHDWRRTPSDKRLSSKRCRWIQVFVVTWPFLWIKFDFNFLSVAYCNSHRHCVLEELRGPVILFVRLNTVHSVVLIYLGTVSLPALSDSHARSIQYCVPLLDVIIRTFEDRQMTVFHHN